MEIRKLTTINYTAENVRELLQYAKGHPVTKMDVSNLSRPGKALAPCLVGYGLYDVKETQIVIKAILQRRLAAEIGRTSPRFLDSQDYRCPECGGITAIWMAWYKCENGHKGVHDVQKLVQKIEKDKIVDEVVRLTDEQFRPIMRAADGAITLGKDGPVHIQNVGLGHFVTTTPRRKR